MREIIDTALFFGMFFTPADGASAWVWAAWLAYSLCVLAWLRRELSA